MRQQRPKPRPRRATVWAVALCVLAALGSAQATLPNDASSPSAALRGFREADTDHDAAGAVQDTTDQDARRITDCARLHGLTPEQVAVFMRDGARRLNCPEASDAFSPAYQTMSEKDRQAAAAAALQQKIAKWENRKNPTPEQILAQADADAARTALAQAQAASNAATATYNKVQAANGIASGADTAALQKQWDNVVTKQDAVTAAYDSYATAANALANANAAKKLDAQQAKDDAALLDLINNQKDEWQKKMEADAAARNEMLAQLQATEAQRQKDLARKEADRQQAELDKQLADEALRKQHEAERKQHEEERLQHEAEAAEAQTKFEVDEQLRLQRERDAKAAAAKNDATATEIKQREDVRVARDQQIAAAEAKVKEEDIDFQRVKAEQVTTQKKYDDLRTQHLQEEQARAAAEAKARADADNAAADEQQKDDDLPDEEKPKRDDEEDCLPSPVGSPPKCENGGRCFRQKGKPETEWCSCGKGYKGDKCEHKPCPPPAKEGNMVNGKCVKWESEYVCPDCDKLWELQLTCRDVEKRMSVREQYCAGLRKPVNKFSKRVCKFCPSGKCRLTRKPIDRPKNPADGYVSPEDPEDPEDPQDLEDPQDPDDPQDPQDPDEAGGPQDPNETDRKRHAKSLRRRLVPVPPPAPWYRFVAAVADRIEAHGVVESIYEHQLVDARLSSPALDGYTKCDCVAQCYLGGSGSNKRPVDALGNPEHMGKKHCTWLLWVPDPATVGTTNTGECRMFNAGTFPDQAQRDGNNQPIALPNGAGTGYLAFVTYPRAFDMFRTSQVLPLRRRRTYTVGLSTFEARFSAGNDAYEGEGTYVIDTSLAQARGGCVATYSTRLEAAKIYLYRTGHLDYKVNIPTQLPGYGGSIAAGTAVPVQSQAPAGKEWTYVFDELLRVHTVSPTLISIPWSHVGSGRKHSDGSFQAEFNFMMRRDVFNTAPGPGAAGHLVAATQRPPNWFFNYVPQHENSNGAKGCWNNVEKAARIFMRKGCAITYNVGLTYPPPGSVTPWDFCYAQFRPTFMSLDFKVTRGALSCAGIAEEWDNTDLFEHVNSQGTGNGHLRTTRLMAFTLHRAVTTIPNSLVGLLSIATTSSRVNKCNTDTGATIDFEGLELLPRFTRAKLVDNSAKGFCLGIVVDGGVTVLTRQRKRLGCTEWSLENGPAPTYVPQALTTNAQQQCIVMGPGRNPFNTVAKIAPYAASGTACLQFVYRRNPYIRNDAVPTSGAIITNPLPANAAFVQDPALPTRTIDDLIIGYIGETTGGGCISWNAATTAFEMTLNVATCIPLLLTYKP